MKINAVEIKPGNILEYENGLWRVVKTAHTQPGKGGAYMQVELKNLRDSGSIEQDADVVMFLHDEDYEGQRTEQSLTEIIFAKQRMAAIGSTFLQPELAFSRFSDTQRLPAPKEPEEKKYNKRSFE